jgi:uncharacterized protein YrrD
MEKGSYLLIEPGMTVHGTDGNLGTVAQVLADVASDVFRGIVVQHGLILTKQFYLPGDQIVSVDGGVVTASVTKAEADQLPAPAALTSETYHT